MRNDLFSLQGRTALVTGGTRGIGKMIARGFLEQGAKVYISGRNPEKAATAAKELSALGSCTALAVDASGASGSKQLAAAYLAREASLDILVHNAGATKFAHFLDATIDQWDFVLNTNARSTWLLAQNALPLMRGRPGARFITITNSMPTKASPRAGLFAVAKSALEMTTQYLSYELAPYGIVTNCVRPGLVQTDVFKVRPDFHGRVEQELEISPWKGGLMTTPENSADVVAMLCLDEASWIAGELITVDGGYRWWGSIGRTRRSGSRS